MPDYATFCPRCHQPKAGETRFIPMIEARVWRCDACLSPRTVIGFLPPNPPVVSPGVDLQLIQAPRLRVSGTHDCSDKRVTWTGMWIPSTWPVPAETACAACVIEKCKLDAVVDVGGVYFRCRQCWTEGALPPESQVAQYVRANLEPPRAPLIELGECPRCSTTSTALH